MVQQQGSLFIIAYDLHGATTQEYDEMDRLITASYHDVSRIMQSTWEARSARDTAATIKNNLKRIIGVEGKLYVVRINASERAWKFPTSEHPA